MWAMATSSMSLFFKGKLFAEPAKVYRLLAIGIAVTMLLLIALSLIGAPLWAAAVIAGGAGGAIQPYLFKDLRYR